MRLLRLFHEPPRSPLELSERLTQDPTCSRCSLHEGVSTVCLPADGEPGGLLVIGEAPSSSDDKLARPQTSKAGRLLRLKIREHWRGPVAFDYAVKCTPGRTEVTEKRIKSCRPYLASVLDDVRPTRILALGRLAAMSVLGRSLAPLSVRHGYGWLVGPPTIPVFTVIAPGQTFKNRFIRQWWDSDIKWALTADVRALRATIPWDSYAKVIETEDDAWRAAAELRANPWVAYDAETTGRKFTPEFRVLSLAVCGPDDEDAWVWGEDALAIPGARAALASVLTDPRVGKVGQDGKFDQHACWTGLGIDVTPIYGDTRLERKMLNTIAQANLELLQELVGMGGGKAESKKALDKEIAFCRRKKTTVDDIVDRYDAVDVPAALAIKEAKDADVKDKTFKPKAYAYALIDHDVRERYNGADAVSTARVFSVIRPAVAAIPDMHAVLQSVVIPAAKAVEQVERWGIAMDLEAIQAFQARVRLQQAIVYDRLRGYGEFNPASTPQLRDFLFKKLKLKPQGMTASGRYASTDADTLERLRDQHPVMGDLLEWRHLDKLRGTYADGLIPWIRSDGRIHPNLQLDGAATGRLSCREPNLQNIPRGIVGKDGQPNEGKMIRDCFMAPVIKRGGRTIQTVLLEFDYSQVELRVAAGLSGDSKMIAIYKSGEDLHLKTAKMIARRAWGIDPDEITDQHPARTAAKTVNFGLLYGKGPHGLARDLGCSPEEAKGIMRAILGEFKDLRDWSEECRREAKRTGYVWTWWQGRRARRRWLYQIADQDDGPRINAENAAVNTPVQGTANEFCLNALVKVVQWIRDDAVPAKLILTIHDALLLEVEEDALTEVQQVVREIMLAEETPGGVPFDVDMKMGLSWGGLAKVKKAS